MIKIIVEVPEKCCQGKEFIMAFGSGDVGLDLGTSSVVICINKKGVVVKESAVVAFDRSNNEVETFGEEAKEVIGRAAGNIIAVHPLIHGTISNYTVAGKMVDYFLWKAVGRRTLCKPRVCVGVPTGATETERKTVADICYSAGARNVVVVDKAVLAALGSGIDIARKEGAMIVDVGGGTTDIAVISMGGTVVGKSIQTAGGDFDEAIATYIKEQYNLLIDVGIAEEIKKKIGTCKVTLQEKSMKIRGYNMEDGMIQDVTVTSSEIRKALDKNMKKIINAIKQVLIVTPPEMKQSVMEQGILLSGGSALLNGMELRIEQELGITTMTSDVPIDCTAIGASKYFSFLSKQRLSRK